MDTTLSAAVNADIDVGADLSVLALQEPPFSLSPDPRYFYLSSQHRTTLSKTNYTVAQRQGLAVIFGDIGTGKTTIARRLYQQYSDHPDYHVAYIPTPHYRSAFQFLKAICAEYGLPPKASRAAQMGVLQAFLVESLEQGRNVALIVDEAQLLVGAQFELLRQLLNFELNDRKLVQIVILGQNQLRYKLDQKPELESRAAALSTLDPLDFPDTRGMVEFRLMVAGRREPLFTDRAMGVIFDYSRGVPRRVCRLGLHVLPAAAMESLRMIDHELVTQVAEGLQ
jgi:general secretion pathway protein A